jgi:hypothetical protein
MRRTLIGLVAGIVIGITFISMSGVGRAATSDDSSQNPLTAWIPDITEIMNGALQDIFISAGAEIEDPEISEFYNRLTSNMMTTIEEGNTVSYTGPEVDFPLIRLATPAHNSTVSGNVFIWVDSVDDLDPIGSLTVTILIDGTTPMVATYSYTSGYYEAMWDSSTVSQGTMHTILATSIDSEANSQSTLGVVLVE